MYRASLEQETNIYLDSAGAALFTEEQLNLITDDLKTLTLGNPHSKHSGSRLTEDLVNQARARILAHFQTTSDEYSVVFTQGATDALKLVAETFCYGASASTIEPPTNIVSNNTFKVDLSESQLSAPCFAYLSENHTSVLGMREYAKKRGVKVYSLHYEQLVRRLENFGKRNSEQTSAKNLFVYPAQSNFCGRKYPLRWISDVQDGALGPGQWYVCLDAASFASTNVLNLQNYKPDFVTVSFYKIFGYPTGIGALLIRNAVIDVLQSSYFGGGTVQVSLPDTDFHVQKKCVSDRLEHGTVNYLSIIALQYGFDMIEKQGGLAEVSYRTFKLVQFTYNSLASMRHENDAPVTVIYSQSPNRFSDSSSQGAILNFNILRYDRSYVGCNEVEKMAELYKIELRTGCFCNQGACQSYLQLSNDAVKNNFEAGKTCGDSTDLIDGRPVGSVRISYGWHSTAEDSMAFLGMLYDCFVVSGNDTCANYLARLRPPQIKPKDVCSRPEMTLKESVSPICRLHAMNTNGIPPSLAAACVPTLTSIHVYPVKSCAPMTVQKWETSDTGLLYDRKWMIVSKEGVCLTQKRYSKLCAIYPDIDLDGGTLNLKCRNSEVHLSLEVADVNRRECESTVCTDWVSVVDCGEAVAAFLSNQLGVTGCRLRRQDDGVRRISKRGENASVSLSNESQFLLVNRRSIVQLHKCIAEKGGLHEIPTEDDLLGRFRANFVIDGVEAFAEENWKTLTIGSVSFTVVGKCTRCQMICIDQKTGEKDTEVLKSLRDTRNGQMTFGIYLQKSNLDLKNELLNVGDSVKWTF